MAHEPIDPKYFADEEWNTEDPATVTEEVTQKDDEEEVVAENEEDTVEDTKETDDGDDGEDGVEPDEVEEAEPEKTSNKSDSVPVNRFSKVTKQRNEATKERDELKHQLEDVSSKLESLLKEKEKPVATKEDVKAIDLDEKEDAYMDALLVGDTKLAKEIRKEIKEEEKRIQTEETNKVLHNTFSAQKAQIEMDTVANFYIEKYPVLDLNKPGHDIKLINAVRDLSLTYQATMPPAKALQKAMDTLSVAFKDLDVKKPVKAVESTKDVKANKERSKEELKKAVDAASKQPASNLGVGDRYKSESSGSLSEKQWGKLTQAERNKLLGFD